MKPKCLAEQVSNHYKFAQANLQDSKGFVEGVVELQDLEANRSNYWQCFITFNEKGTEVTFTEVYFTNLEGKQITLPETTFQHETRPVKSFSSVSDIVYHILRLINHGTKETDIS
jgi:hypothetical protein